MKYPRITQKLQHFIEFDNRNVDFIFNDVKIISDFIQHYKSSTSENTTNRVAYKIYGCNI